MVHLDLSAEEQQILHEILDGYLSDLRMEIANTDRLDYRELLKRRKEILIKTLAGLQGSAG